jgi:hypothetical protein
VTSCNRITISPVYFRHLIGVVHNSGVIRRFQIVQDARDHAVLALETEPTAAESAVGDSIGDIRRDLMTVFGPGMNLEINRIDRIPESGAENSPLASIKPPSPPFNEFFDSFRITNCKDGERGRNRTFNLLIKSTCQTWNQ